MRILWVILVSLFPLILAAQGSQSRSELEKNRQSILESIRATQEQLELTKKNKNATMAQLRALQNKVAERQRLINHINQEIDYINNSIQLSSREVTQLQQNLGILRTRYAQSIRYAYKNRSSYSMIAFLFSSEDFNEAVRRLKYLKKYREYRKEQADQIRLTQTNIEKKIHQLNTERSEKDMLRSTEEQQKLVIVRETNEKDKVVQELKGREKELGGVIVRNQKSLRQMEKAIQTAIQREIELAKKREEEERRRLAEEQRKREEEQRRALAASNPGVNVATGSGTRNIGGSPATGPVAKNPATPAVTTPPKTTSYTPGASISTARPSYSLSLTPEATALSNNFESNRGKLPWPVEKGFIAERFGRTKHPVYNIMLENSGIEIQTAPNASARAVFDGTVKSILVVPGMGQCVLVDHGRFFTVYSRLGNVSVKKGASVAMKQTIGQVIANENGEYLMHFELWKVAANDKSAAQDPALWIAR
jgi:septal ring factor EnvC (AmiA/AmiB activator)